MHILQITYDPENKMWKREFPAPDSENELIEWLGFLEQAKDMVKLAFSQHLMTRMRQGLVGPDGQPVGGQ